MPRGLRARGLCAIRIVNGTIEDARPVGHLVQVERKPARQQHDLDRHHRHRAPGHLAEQREADPREHVAARRAAAGEDRRARPRHVRRVRIVADQLERIVGLDGRAEVEIAAHIQRPAAMIRLPRAQIDRDLVLERLVDLAEEVLEQDVMPPESSRRLRARTPSGRPPAAALPDLAARPQWRWSTRRQRRRGHASRAHPIRSGLLSDLEAFYHHHRSTLRHVTDFLPEHKLSPAPVTSGYDFG